jgi:hypothetical protein
MSGNDEVKNYFLLSLFFMKKESHPKGSRPHILLVSNNSRAAKNVEVIFLSDGFLTERLKIVVVVIPPDKGGP